MNSRDKIWMGYERKRRKAPAIELVLSGSRTENNSSVITGDTGVLVAVSTSSRSTPILSSHGIRAANYRAMRIRSIAPGSTRKRTYRRLRNPAAPRGVSLPRTNRSFMRG